MSDAVFTLHVPAAAPFRGLASDLVGRYIELSGRTDAEREAFTAALADAIDGLQGGPDDLLLLVCTTRPAGFDVSVACGTRSVVVRHPLPAGAP
jgi:hypothetical protein